MNEPLIERRVLSDEVLTLRPGARLDNNNAHHMVAAITEAQAGGFRQIIIEMAGVEFLSSAGVGSLLGTVEASREKGGDLILSGPSENILHVLKVLDLADYFTIVPGEAEALARAGLGAR